MRRIIKFLFSLVVVLGLMLSFSTTAFADDIDDTGGTDGGGSGTNVYTFYYAYDSSKDAIVLTVNCLRPINDFGNSTSHTFSSASDSTYIPSSNPRLGSSLESAISAMNSAGGYELNISDVKAKLNNLGYYDGGNGIWRRSGGYLTYIDAKKIRPTKHTVHYDANGGTGAPADQTKKQDVTLTLRTKKPTRTGWTFKYWIASIGGHYNPGGAYTHDQDGGVVTMKAYWKDETAPSFGSFYAIPNYWSAGNGTIGFSVQDEGSGIKSIVLERYSYVTRGWSTFRTWSYSGTKSLISKTLTESSEGVFKYRLTVTDKEGNSASRTSDTIYLDHSNPVLYGMETTNTEWTNVAPVINVRATDYLLGTTYTGSDLAGIEIFNDSGRCVSDGVHNAMYTLQPRDEGIHTWRIVATDNVGHSTTTYITTKYDITKPGIDGTEITYVLPDGTYVSGYCQDNIINQHIDDETWRSSNNPNVSSGLKSVILYRVTGGNKQAIWSDQTRATFGSSNTHSAFNMYYEIQRTERTASYYEIVVSDYAGNITRKKLTSQYSLLTWFHTSIDRSSYNK